MTIKSLCRKACLSLTAGLVWVCPSLGQTQLSQYRPGVTPEGAVYFLPRTMLRISVLVEKTVFTPGDFSPYAQRYLRVADAGQESSTAFRVIGISQTAMPLADTTKVYAVRFDARTAAAHISLSDDGRLLGINIDDASDIVAPQPFVPAEQPTQTNPRQFLGEEVLSCGSTAKMAELIAHEIYDLRENKSLLIKGQADFMPHDGLQMQIMLNELQRHDEALTSLFLGTTRRDTTEHVLWVEANEPVEHQVLFRLSQVHGLVEADDLSGAPYYISIEDITQLPTPEPEGKKKGNKATVQGIYVNVPGRLRCTLYEGINALQTEEHPAPQFGQVMLLSSNLFNKRYSTRLWVDALTGAMLRLDADQPN